MTTFDKFLEAIAPTQSLFQPKGSDPFSALFKGEDTDTEQTTMTQDSMGSITLEFSNIKAIADGSTELEIEVATDTMT